MDKYKIEWNVAIHIHISLPIVWAIIDRTK